MDPLTALSTAASVIQFIEFSLKVAAAPFEAARDLVFYLGLYGPAGLLLWVFGSRSIWQLQTEVINLKDENIAFKLKKLVQEESEIVAVAASIIAQVAITALSLNALSQAHWTARGSFILSLVSAIMAIYAASSEYRMFCWCVNAEEIQQWIMGSSKFQLREESNRPKKHIPSIASVITISAPFALLVAALNSFLVGFGIWLGFVWTRNLDPNSTYGDSRAVFITYAVGLGTCYLVYTLSNISAGPHLPLSTWAAKFSEPVLHQAQPKEKAQKRDYGQKNLFQQHNQGPQIQGSTLALTSRPESLDEEISKALRQAAELRRELAESEEHLADLYGCLRRERSREE
ncbi:hypothetical protein GGR58DRAFT_462332 [Xylaria digitata]|nr:hypothetical protein GGR58DRAFT_462332 [Xylaria digitata]